MIHRTESPLIGYTRIQRRLQSGGIPYNFPRSIRIVCRLILKKRKNYSCTRASKNSLIDQAVASGYIRRRKVKRPKGQVGNPVLMMNYITSEGKQLELFSRIKALSSLISQSLSLSGIVTAYAAQLQNQ